MSLEELNASRREAYQRKKIERAEELKAQRQAYYEANKDKIKEASKARYERVKDTDEFKAAEAARRERQRNDPEFKEKKRAYYEATKHLRSYEGKDWSAEYQKRKASGYYTRPEYVEQQKRKYHDRMALDQDYRETRKAWSFKNRSGSAKMSRAEADAHAASQNNLCYICHRPPSGNGMQGRLHVDHCHLTGRFRKMLCATCNRILGFACDDHELMAETIRNPALFSEEAARRGLSPRGIKWMLGYSENNPDMIMEMFYYLKMHSES